MDPLICCVKRYDWGSLDGDSIVARFARGPPPYAEAWIGTHPQGVSILARSGEPLSAELPFMLKFLSVGRSLSIQLHPDAMHARRLHARDPSSYADSSSKPEMAIALKLARALVGFRVDWRDALSAHAELPRFESIDELVRYATTDDRAIEACYAIAERSDPGELFRTIWGQHPGDPGVLIALAMNDVQLRPREAIAIRPGTVHAYLSGDFVECMARSDNVIRLGLTSKPRDLNAAFECMDAEPSAPVLIGEPSDSVYESGFEEFEVAFASNAIFRCRDAALLAVSDGEGRVECDGIGFEASVGYAFYVAPGSEVKITGTLEAWVATRAGAFEAGKNLRT